MGDPVNIAAVGAIATVPFVAAEIPDANLVLNLLTVAVILLGAPRFFKSKNAEAALTEKDRTISTREQSLAAERDRRAELEREIASIRERSAEYQRIAAGFQARYEEQSKYTAKEALTVLQQTLNHQNGEAERRHTEVLAVLTTMQELLEERRQRNLVDPPDG